MTTPLAPLWPLDQCLSTIKALGPSIAEPRQAAQIYTAAVGLLCHLKKERMFLRQRIQEQPDASFPVAQVPAMAAVLSDPALFQALLRCLRVPPPTESSTNNSITGTHKPARLHHHHHHLHVHHHHGSHRGSIVMNHRKRSPSITDPVVDSPSPALTRSPLPAGKKYTGDSQQQLQQQQQQQQQPQKVGLPFQSVATTILVAAMQYLDHWPAPLMAAYAEDTLGPRLWVDRKECQPLVDNLKLIFDTEQTATASPDQKEGLVVEFYRRIMAQKVENQQGVSWKPTAQQQEQSMREKLALPFADQNNYDDNSDSGEEEIVEVSTGTAVLSHTQSNGGDDSSSSGEEEVVSSSDPIATKKAAPETPQFADLYPAFPTRLNTTRTRQRYFGANRREAFEAITTALEQRLETKSKQNSRLLQTLPIFCAVPGVRVLAAKNLAKWLQSPALSGGARTLFASIVNQLQTMDPPLADDLEAVDAILEMQLKANQLNMHIENVTLIAKRIPSAALSRHMFLKLLKIELAGMDDAAKSTTEHMQMISTIHGVLKSSLSNDGIAAAVLTILASPEDTLTRPERDALVRKLRKLIRKIASCLGNSFDGCGLIESLLSFDIDEQSWTARDEEDKGRILVECIALLVPAQSNHTDVSLPRGKQARKQFAKPENGITTEEKAVLARKLRVARKLLISWACSDYSPLWQAEKAAVKELNPSKKRKKPEEEKVGAGTPNYTSVLDRKSNLRKESLCPDAIKCVLFMVEPESDTMKQFLFPEGFPKSDDLVRGDLMFRIKQCHQYGTDLDDDMLRIILGSAKEESSGIDSEMALSLIEHLFSCCGGGRKGSLHLKEASTLWDMYELVEYTPPKVFLGAVNNKPQQTGGADEDNQFADAEEDDQFADADEMDIDTPLTNGSALYKGNDRGGGSSAAGVPRLAYPGMWWRVTSLALVMVGASPGVIGPSLSAKHPTLRSLVKMVTSGRYRFPTVDCDDEEREKMKTRENGLREKESEVTQLLFIPPAPKEKKKKPTKTFTPAGSRASARQRTKYERMMKEKREKEAAAALTIENNRKKKMKAAQKTIMLWDPQSDARKPPKESVGLILAVQELFGLSRTFRESTEPDLVLVAIGNTSRGAIERAYDWLIPVISSLPSVISRLPATASCFLLLRAYGTEGERNSELRELSAPLLEHVQKTMTGEFGVDDAKRAAGILFADVSDKKPERRRCARRVLQEAFAEPNKKINDRSFDGADCTWLFSVLTVNHAEALVPDAIQYIANALTHERGRVLRALTFSLKCYIEYAADKGTAGHWNFPVSLCNLISERQSVWSESMMKFADLLELVISVIFQHFHSFLSTGAGVVGSPEVDEVVRLTLCQADEQEQQPEMHVPLSLLHSICVLLSIWKEPDGESSANESKTMVHKLADALMLPQDTEEEADVLDIDCMDGIASATLLDGDRRAVAVEQWVMLAKARSDFVARRAALAAPAKFLPRLLLCSGLPKTSLLTMIDRLGQLGENPDKDESRVFRDLLAPSSTSDWGFGHLGTRRGIVRKLIGRLSAYISLHGESIESLSSNVSLTFLNWLSEENQPVENPKKLKMRRAKKSMESFKLSDAQSILEMALSSDPEEDLDDEGAEATAGSPPMTMEFKATAIERPPIALAEENVVGLLKVYHDQSQVIAFEEVMRRQFLTTTAKGRKRKRERTEADENESASVAVSTALARIEDSNLEWKRARGSWIPALTVSRGSSDLWTCLFSKELGSEDQDSMLQECCMSWSPTHVHDIKSWILPLLNGQGAGLSASAIVRFLLLTCGQIPGHTRSFHVTNLASPDWMNNKDSVDYAVKAVYAAAQVDRESLDARNHIPCWLQLALLVAQAGKHQANHVVNTLMLIVEKEKASRDMQSVVAVAILRIYSSLPFLVNLGNAKLRSALLEASKSVNWKSWRTPLDFQIDNMLGALQSQHCPRLVQALVDIAKSHPLILLRKMDLMAQVLDKDAGSTLPLRSTNRTRVYGENFEGPALALFHGSRVKVMIRHWGYSFSDPLWLSVLDVLLAVPKEVLFSCGLPMGLEELLGVFVKVLYIQSQLQNRDKATRLRTRFTDLLKIFEKHEEWNSWLSSQLDGADSQSIRNVLISSSLITTEQAMQSIKAMQARS